MNCSLGLVESRAGMANEISRDDFLDNLIAPTTTTARKGKGHDASGVGDMPFLTELVAKNNARPTVVRVAELHLAVDDDDVDIHMNNYDPTSTANGD